MAFGISDLLSLLDKIPQWARIRASPDRCDELERRVAALEQRPNLPLCEKCGVGYMRLDRQEAPTGTLRFLPTRAFGSGSTNATTAV
jgi:hypothetical protein